MMANQPRNYYRYHYLIGHRIRHSGVTKDPERREEEHRHRWPGGHLRVVRPAVTKETALEWEETKRRSTTPHRKK